MVLTRSRSLTLAVALTLNIAAARAEPDADVGIDSVVVTANRIEQPTARVADSITVISAEEVRNSQVTAVSDLIAMTPGVAVARNGGFGATTTIRIRGAESEQTTVLIDGVKLNDPSSAGSGYNFANLIATEYARIEILRGPQSTLWGSQAIGGVVNIVTPVPEGPLNASVSAEGGSNETAFFRARAEAGNDRFGWRVGGNYLTSDGISAFSEKRGATEADGYRNVGFNARGIFRFNDTVSAELRSTWSKSRNDFDGFRQVSPFDLMDTRDYGDTEELVTYVGVNLSAFDGRFDNRFGFAYTDTDRQDFDPASTVPMTFDASGSNKRWEYQGTLKITDTVQGVIGLESERSDFDTVSPTTFDPNPTPLNGDAELDSAYAQVIVSPIDTVTLTAGLRYDDHDTFGNKTTTRASAAWSVLPSTILRASYGEGFKAPTLYQLYSEYGNLALEAEEAEGWDAGVEQRLFDDKVSIAATYFHRDTDNMIDFISCFDVDLPICADRPFGGYYENLQKTQSEGIELSFAAHLGERLHLSANYTSMDAENNFRGSANFGRSLPRRPNETANAQVSYEWPVGLTTTVAVQHAGRSYDNVSNSFVLDSYTLVDLRASYAVTKSLEVFGRAENLFDEEYETVRRYGTFGRTFYAGLRQSF